jgi:hypothetical protein
MTPSNRSRSGPVRRVLTVLLGPRGATTVEYAIILVAVLLLSAGAWKLLGSSLAKRGNVAGDTVAGTGGGGSSSGSGSGGGSHTGGKSGSGVGGSGGGGEKMSAASKVTVGGVGGAAGESGGSSSGKPSRVSSESSSGGAGGPIGSMTSGHDSGGGDVAEGFTAKRWFGIGLLGTGVLAIGYVFMSLRRAKKAGDAMAKDPKGKPGAAGKGSAPPPLA